MPLADPPVVSDAPDGWAASVANAPILALDTSTEALSLALQCGDRIWRHDGPGGAQASSTLIPAVMALLDRAQVALPDVGCIAFGQGPGAFTGLRTACAVAQGLGLGIQARGNSALVLLPVNSLLLVAEEARLQADPDATSTGAAPATAATTTTATTTTSAHSGPPQNRRWPQRVLALLDARMGEVYVAEVDFDGADEGERPWHQPLTYLAKPDQVMLPAAWHRPESGQCDGVAAGNVFGVHGDALAWPAAVPRIAAWPTARALLSLAPRLLALGLGVQPDQAAPLYVRDKVAQTTAERLGPKPALRDAAQAADPAASHEASAAAR